MSRYLSLAVAAALVVCGTSSAEAAKTEKGAKKKAPDIGAIFAKLDANNDGKVDEKEFSTFTGLVKSKRAEQGKAPAGSAEGRNLLFKKLDTNNDKSLSLEEFSKIKEVVGEAVKKKKKKNDN